MPGKLEFILQCVADDQIWIWHLVFGFPGALNNLVTLNSSSLLEKNCAGIWPVNHLHFYMEGRIVDRFYWVGDDIFQLFQLFLKFIYF